MTIAFVGEHEQAGDPQESPGVNDWVFQELLNGYDVHVWDDGHDVLSFTDDCDEWGEGRAFDEVCNAINNREVTNVAMMGYSHGGGSVYHLAWRMFFDGITSDNNGYSLPPQKITKQYGLVFTSYIDAVPNDYYTNGILGTSLDDRPFGSLFHTNQYQTNSWVSGCSVPDSDDDINRSYLSGIEHSGGGETGIDTNSIVLDFLTERFHQKVVK